MSLLYSVVYATRCRSTHHRIALDSLRFLEGPDAVGWRLVFLHHHDQYLKGAKAPDDVFKDFKNHVLHVREGDWGGAREAAEEWRKRLVRALQAKDWTHAAWCAGVMSHYCVDPLQPFHTHQTEEENAIHRAVEWSYFKSYATLRELIESAKAWPKVQAPDREGWLGDMVRDGARLSTQSYEFVVDHYNFEAGVKQPQRGLDQPLREAIAKLLACAIVAWARILEKVIGEAGVKPPRLDGGLQAFFLALEAPIQSALGLIGDVKERALLARQYEEFRKTGKVRSTLSEDDSTVRALYAAEVLKLPLSSLDARWPREIGTAHDSKAKRRKVRKEKLQKAKKAEVKKEKGKLPQRPPTPPQAAEAQKPQAAEAQKPQKAAAKTAAPPPATPPPPFFTPAAAAPAPPPGPAAPAASPFFSPGAAAPQPAQAAPPPAPAPKQKEPAPPPRESVAKQPDGPPLLLTKKVKPPRGVQLEQPGGLRFNLRGASPLADAPSIGPKTAKKFYAVGIRTVSDLLAISPAAAAVLVNARRITAPMINDWQAQAMLACTVPELKARDALALVACDVRDIESLAEAEPAALGLAMREWRSKSTLPGIDAMKLEDSDMAALIARARAALAAREKSPEYA